MIDSIVGDATQQSIYGNPGSLHGDSAHLRFTGLVSMDTGVVAFEIEYNEWLDEQTVTWYCISHFSAFFIHLFCFLRECASDIVKIKLNPISWLLFWWARISDQHGLYYTRSCKYLACVSSVLVVLKEIHSFPWCSDIFQLFINIWVI